MDRRIRLRNLSKRDIESLNRASENLASLHVALAQARLHSWPMVERLIVEANQAIIGVYEPALASLMQRLEERTTGNPRKDTGMSPEKDDSGEQRKIDS